MQCKTNLKFVKYLYDEMNKSLEVIHELKEEVSVFRDRAGRSSDPGQGTIASDKNRVPSLSKIKVLLNGIKLKHQEISLRMISGVT